MKKTPLDEWIRQKMKQPSKNLTREAVAVYQLNKINETLENIKTNSAFYRQRFSGFSFPVANFQDFVCLPFTTADDLRRDPASLVCVSQDEISRIVTLDTSGTTGQPKRCYFTLDDQELTIDFFGVGMSTLVSAGDRVLILLPDRTPGSVGDLLYQGLERIGVQPFKHGPVTDLDETLQTITRLNINSLVGAPVQVLALVRYQQLWPEKYPVMIKSVLLSTDYLSQSLKDAIIQAWNCEVFNHYGTTEMGLGGGVFCEAQTGFHLREADMYFEIIAPQTGRPLPDGEMGEVVFTTLTRRGMPLVRYRTGDFSRFIDELCPCGTALRTLQKISGRVDQYFTISEKKYLIGEMDDILFNLPGLINYYLGIIHDKDKERLVFTLYSFAPSGKFTADFLASLLSNGGIQVNPRDIEIISHTGYPEALWSLRKRSVREEFIC